TQLGTVSSAAVCRCRPLPTPDAKPWQEARLGPALLSGTPMYAKHKSVVPFHGSSPCRGVGQVGRLAQARKSFGG
ncbi:MAG: hypothetical protein GYB15_18760, partial [Gammaproteobacteria bacterium]|nr:hypothetical protein [Gammaproteobacteria bacterium]